MVAYQHKPSRSATGAARDVGRTAAVGQRGPRERSANGTVTAISVGTARDGGDQVTVTVRGNPIVAPYLASYTPRAVGDIVRVSYTDNSPFIWGRVAGLPNF